MPKKERVSAIQKSVANMGGGIELTKKGRELNRKIGAIQGLRLSAAQSRVTIAAILHDIKSNSLYENDGYKTWQDFITNGTNFSISTANEYIRTLDTIGEDALGACSNLGLTVRQLRALTSAQSPISCQPSENGTLLEYKGKKVPIEPGNEEAVKALFDEVRNDKEVADQHVIEIGEVNTQLEAEIAEMNQPKTTVIPSEQQYKETLNTHEMTFLACIGRLEKLLHDTHGNAKLFDLFAAHLEALDKLLVERKDTLLSGNIE